MVSSDYMLDPCSEATHSNFARLALVRGVKGVHIAALPLDKAEGDCAIAADDHPL